MKNKIASCIVLFAAITTTPQTSGQMKQGNTGKHGAQPCVFDYERGEVSDCVFIAHDGSRFIAPRYLKDLRYESNGLASVRGTDGWMYVNRRGRVLISRVPTFDNGPDQFRDGLVRLVEEHKYGFADQSGRVVIPPQYDGALPFDDGRAKVCSGCLEKCADDGCEHHVFSGGEWSSVNKNGLTVK